MADTGLSTAQRQLAHGSKYPYDGGSEAAPAIDWAHVAARGVMADLLDRRGVKWELEKVDLDVRADIVTAVAAIVRAALASRPAEVDDERQWVVVGGRRAGRTFLAALARDAERYRWMRNAQWFKAGIAKTELNASSFHYSGDLLDQLVDAGRAAVVHGEGAGK
jgi:hypothetical protein